MIRKGLANQIELETLAALEIIYKKYRIPRKKAFTRDRIIGIMYGAFYTLRIQTLPKRRGGDLK